MSSQTLISGSVYDGSGGPLTLANSPYQVMAFDKVDVPAGKILTIEAGVEIRMKKGAFWDIQGVLLARGSNAGRIRFVAFDPGDLWGYLKFAPGSAGVLEYCDVAAGGRSGSRQVWLDSPARVSLSECTIVQSGGDGIMGALLTGDSLSVVRCRFSDNAGDGIELSAESTARITLDRNDLLSNSGFAYHLSPNIYPKAGDLAGNSFDGIVLRPGTVSVSGAYDMDLLIRKSGRIVISDEAEVVLLPGKEVFMESGAEWMVQGSLIAEGTGDQHIRFRSRGSEEFWDQLQFAAGGKGVLKFCDFDHGGGSGGGQIRLNYPAKVIIENCAISQGKGDGVTGITSQGDSLVITQSTISNNAGDGIDLSTTAAADIRLLDNVLISNAGSAYHLSTDIYPVGGDYSGNGFDGITLKSGDAEVSGAYGINLQLRQSTEITISEGVEVALMPGVEVLMGAGAGWTVQGRLSAEGHIDRHILFTGVIPGENWDAVRIVRGGDASFRYCEFEYGGEGNAGQIRLDHPRAVVLEECIVANSGSFGLVGALGRDYPGTLTISDCVFTNNALDAINLTLGTLGTVTIQCNLLIANGRDGFRVAGGDPVVAFNQFSGNVGNGVTNVGSTAINVADNWWADAGGPAGLGPGAGDEVGNISNGSVIFQPWADTYQFPQCTDQLAISAVLPDEIIAQPGVKTLQVVGNGFSSSTELWLEKRDSLGTKIFPVDLSKVPPTLVEATFDFTTIPTGPYDLLIAEAGEVVQKRIYVLPYLPIIEYNYYNRPFLRPGVETDHTIKLSNHGTAPGVALVVIVAPPGFEMRGVTVGPGGRLVPNIGGDSVAVVIQPVAADETQYIKPKFFFPWTNVLMPGAPREWGKYYPGDPIRTPFALLGAVIPEAWTIVEQESTQAGELISGAHWASLLVGGYATDEYLELNRQDRLDYIRFLGKRYPFVADALVTSELDRFQFAFMEETGLGLEEFSDQGPIERGATAGVLKTQHPEDIIEDAVEGVKEVWTFIKALGVALYDEWESGRAGARIVGYFEGLIEGGTMGFYRPNLGADHLAHITGVSQEDLQIQRFAGNMASILTPTGKWLGDGIGKGTKWLGRRGWIPRPNDIYTGKIKLALKGNDAEPVHWGFDLLSGGEKNIFHFGIHQKFGPHIGMGWASRLVSGTKNVYQDGIHLYLGHAFVPYLPARFQEIPIGFWQIAQGMTAYETMAHPAANPSMCTQGSMTLSTSIDPNQIDHYPRGPYILHTQQVSYQVSFENLAGATLPAERVRIRLPLDPDLDLGTLRIEGSSHPALEKATVDSVNATVNWLFEGINLPPNATPPEGEGWVRLSAYPKPDVVTGAEIIMQAEIIFDNNPAIATNISSLIVDRDAPVSRISALPDTLRTAAFPIPFVAADSTSGIREVGLWVAEKELSSAIWPDTFYRYAVADADDGQFDFTGNFGYEYRFFTRAFDNVGIREIDPDSLSSSVKLISGIRDPKAIPPVRVLIYPNPFTGQTHIAYQLLSPAYVRIRILNALGQPVEVLRDHQLLSPGHYEEVFDAADLPAGIYFCHFIVADQGGRNRSFLEKMTLLHW